MLSALSTAFSSNNTIPYFNGRALTILALKHGWTHPAKKYCFGCLYYFNKSQIVRSEKATVENRIDQGNQYTRTDPGFNLVADTSLLDTPRNNIFKLRDEPSAELNDFFMNMRHMGGNIIQKNSTGPGHYNVSAKQKVILKYCWNRLARGKNRGDKR